MVEYNVSLESKTVLVTGAAKSGQMFKYSYLNVGILLSGKTFASEIHQG